MPAFIVVGLVAVDGEEAAGRALAGVEAAEVLAWGRTGSAEAARSAPVSPPSEK